ncbi:MAG: M67 family metallopeptidase [Gammaproteobacteria bacterium]|nr:M67 family metallopeptidase [Gammaproteobacteria bacterium]MBT8134405.1 M67 family metallopeptidase [Gammaproteobacteria bacterium]NNJ50968.1 M67 family metallopeptidase [Gammaproteobacteria bacterium]
MPSSYAKKQEALYLPRPLVNKLLAHAQSNPDIEACGLISNDEENEKHYYPIDNIAKNPSCRFLMDAPQQIHAMKKMREEGQALFAIVHSHPTSQAIPSDLDIVENNYRDAFYIIISLNTKGVLEMRAYVQRDDGMQEVDLILEDRD